MAQGFLSIDFLDVGQGDGTLIVFPDDTTVLVDMGSKKNADVAGGDAIQYVHAKLLELQARRDKIFPTIDILFLTHGDEDHYNLIVPLIESFGEDDPLEIQAIYIGGELSEYDPSIRDGLLDEAVRLEILTVFEDAEHDPIGLPGWVFDDPEHDLQAYIYLLSVNVPKRKGPKNAKSICLMGEYASRKVILMGDAEDTTEGYIQDWYQAASPSYLHCDALKLGHHGSQKADTKEWLQATQPWCVFVSSDQKWAHPYCTALQRVIQYAPLDRDKIHPWICGKGANASKQYFFWAEDETNNDLDIYTNLAFQKFLKGSSDEEQNLIERINQTYDSDNVLPDGIVLGVQYSFQVRHDGAVAVVVTNLITDQSEVLAQQGTPT
ncbi:MAG: ComEC/Rec2 family competence protein [Thermoanaerobaculia bacterium]